MKQVEDAYNGETIVNSEQKYNFQYHYLSSIGKLQNVFQEGVDIVRKVFWQIRWDNSFISYLEFYYPLYSQNSLDVLYNRLFYTFHLR